MRLDTGALDIGRVSRIRQINEKPFLNIQKNVFNGTGFTSMQLNPYKNKVMVGIMTNGMQYKPDTNDGSIFAYDNLMQRDIQYSYSSDVDYSSVAAKKFTEFTFDNPSKQYLDSP